MRYSEFAKIIWMQIDEAALLYGLDHINRICNDIDDL